MRFNKLFWMLGIMFLFSLIFVVASNALSTYEEFDVNYTGNWTAHNMSGSGTFQWNSVTNTYDQVVASGNAALLDRPINFGNSQFFVETNFSYGASPGNLYPGIMIGNETNNYHNYGLFGGGIYELENGFMAYCNNGDTGACFCRYYENGSVSTLAACNSNGNTNLSRWIKVQKNANNSFDIVISSDADTITTTYTSWGEWSSNVQYVGMYVETDGGGNAAFDMINYTDTTIAASNSEASIIYPTGNLGTTNSYAEINISLNATSLDTFGFLFNNTNYTIFDGSLVGMYGMDYRSELGDTTTNIADSSLYGNNGTYSGETFTNGVISGATYTTGVYGTGLQLNSASSNYVNASQILIPDVGEWSYTAWINVQDYNSYYALFGQNDAGVANRTQAYVEQTTGKIVITDTSGYTSTAPQAIGTGWHHVAIIKNNATTSIDTYYDGVLNKTTSINVDSAGHQQQYTILGGANPTTNMFNGTMDDIRFYNHPLTAAEVSAIATNNTFYRDGLVAYYRFNEGSGTTATDTHNIVLQENAEGSIFEGAINFNSVTNTRLAIGAPVMQNDTTLSLWVKATEPTGEWGGIFGNTIGLQLTYRNSTKSIYSMNSGTNSGSFNCAVDTWCHVTVVLKEDTRILYYNGVQQTNNSVITPTSQTLYLGFNGNGYFAGTIDEVKIYNRALTLEEITFNYNNTLQKFGGDGDKYTYYANITGLSDAIYEYGAWLNDSAGAGAYSYTPIQYYYVDTTVPSNITIYSPENISYITYRDANLTINFSAFDNVRIDQCWFNLNDTANTTNTCDALTTFLANEGGDNTLAFFANDSVDNVVNNSIAFSMDSLTLINLSIEIYNEFENTSMNTFYIVLNNTDLVTFNDTNTTSEKFDFYTMPNNYTYCIYRNNWFDYCTLTVAYTTDTLDYAYLHDGELIFTANEVVSNNLIDSYSVLVNNTDTLTTKTVSTTNGNYTINLSSGNYTVTFIESYHDAWSSYYTVLPLEQEVSNAQMYNDILNLSANHAMTGDAILPFNINITSLNYTDWREYNTTTNGLLQWALINGTYTITLSEENYTTAEVNLTVDGSLQAYTFSIYVFNTLIMNFLDEITKQYIDKNVSLELISDSYSINTSTDTGNYTFELFIPETYTIRYGAVAEMYPARLYYFTLLNDSYDNLTLYLLSSDLGTNISTTTYDEIGNALEGVTIKALRYDIVTNTYLLVEECRSDYEGKCNLNLEKNNEFYKFILEYEGVVKTTTNPRIITSDELTFNVNTGTDVLSIFYTVNSVSVSLSFDNTTDLFRYEFVDTNGAISQGCLEVYAYTDDRMNFQNESCVVSSSGIIFLPASNATANMWQAKAFVYVGDDKQIVGSLLQEYRQGEFPNSNYGYFLVLVMTIVILFIGSWSPSIAIILLPVPLFIASMLKLVNLSTSGAIGYIVISLIILYVMGTFKNARDNL